VYNKRVLSGECRFCATPRPVHAICNWHSQKKQIPACGDGRQVQRCSLHLASAKETEIQVADTHCISSPVSSRTPVGSARPQDCNTKGGCFDVADPPKERNTHKHQASPPTGNGCLNFRSPATRPCQVRASRFSGAQSRPQMDPKRISVQTAQSAACRSRETPVVVVAKPKQQVYCC